MRSPLAVVAAAFAAGIALAWWAGAPAWGVACAAACAVALGRRRRGSPARANLTLLALVLLAGAGRAAADGRVPADSVAHLVGPDPRPAACEGVLVRDDSWYPAGGGRGRRTGWLEVERVRFGEAWAPASGRVQLRLPARAGPARVGDRLRVQGLLRGPREAAGPGPRRFNEARWLWTRGACGVLSVSDAEPVITLGPAPGPWPWLARRAADLRERLRERGRELVEPEAAGYLEALLLGEGRGIPAEDSEAFRRTGTIHILVVSGFQVGLIGGIALVALSLARVPRGPRYLLTGLALAGYCLLTGAAPPVLRATVTGLLLCLGQYKGREVSSLNLLGAAALVILASGPRALADVSFQLSFAAVLGILWAARWATPKSVPGTEPVPGTGKWLGTWYRFAGQAFAVSLGAWAAVTPLVAWHMGAVSLIAPAVNLAAVPLGSALVADGFLLYTVGSLWPAAAVPFAASFTLLARLTAGLAGWAASLPGASFRW